MPLRFLDDCCTVHNCVVAAVWPAGTSTASWLVTADGPQAFLNNAGAAWAAVAAAVPGPGSETGAFTPGPVHIGWEVYVGAIAGVIPFAIGAYEFSKRIVRPLP